MESDPKEKETTSAEAEVAGEEKKDEGGTEGARSVRPEDWPLKDISEPHDNDVLYGRGGGTNHHKGNKRYRKMVEDRKVDYVNSKRLDKPMVALEIVRTWRAQDPPGRFLKLNEKTNTWNDVGDRKAREKISQALREKAPQIRKQQEDERMRKEGKIPEEKKPEEKQTTFAPGTVDNTSKEGKPVLARDHSLGREYLKDNEQVNLDNFSWQDPFRADSQGRTLSQGSMAPPPPYNPHMRVGSHSSMGPYAVPPPGAYPYRYDSHGSLPAAPPPGTHSRMSSEEKHHYMTQQRVESWSSLGPPPPMPGVAPNPQGSWTAPDNSLGQFPLPHASIGQAAQYSTFDQRGHSGQWGPYPPPPPGDGSIPYHYATPPPAANAYPHAPPPPPVHYASPHHSPHHGPPPGAYGAPPPPGHAPPPPPGHAPGPPELPHGPPVPTSPAPTKKSPQVQNSPSYGFDTAVASTWSGQSEDDIVKTLSSEGYEQTPNEAPSNPDSPRSNVMPKPTIVKRMTSNQNETVETKPDLQGTRVKRCALNRDSSRASNRLKELSFPKQFRNGKFDTKKEIDELGLDMEQSRLSTSPGPMDTLHTLDVLPSMDELHDSEHQASRARAPKPTPLSSDNRVSTIDDIAMDLMARPVAFDKSGRSSTIEALALDFVENEHDDPVIRASPGSEKLTLDNAFADLADATSRPPALGYSNRLTTNEFVTMINAPIPDDDLRGDERQAMI